MSNDDLTDFSDLHDSILRNNPQVRAAWDRAEQKRKLSMFLVNMRTSAGFTQRQLAEAVRWDKSFISRLEAASGPVPALETISKYAQACGFNIGLVTATREDESHLKVQNSVSLQAGEDGFDKIEQDEVIKVYA